MLIADRNRAARAPLVRLAGPALIAAVFCAGCAAPGPRGEVPLGHWSGEGAFVYESWGQSGPHSIHKPYPTTLSIQPGQIDDRDVILLEIQSDRGPLPELGDKTHLKVALAAPKRVAPCTVLYRVVNVLFNPGPDQVLSFDDTAPPFGASCITRDGTTTFSIDYMDNFVDTFRFRGDRLEKAGVYYSKENGLIHWAERLKRDRPAQSEPRP